jgi:hypothetical protein
MIMKTLSNVLLVVAQRKAARATENYIDLNGENPMGCGFAWVSVKNVRGKKAELLKEFGFSKSYVAPGLRLHNPSQNTTQDMDAKMAGAEVYANMLREFGIDAQAYCRLD